MNEWMKKWIIGIIIENSIKKSIRSQSGNPQTFLTQMSSSNDFIPYTVYIIIIWAPPSNNCYSLWSSQGPMFWSKKDSHSLDHRYSSYHHYRHFSFMWQVHSDTTYWEFFLTPTNPDSPITNGCPKIQFKFDRNSWN